MTQHTVSVKKIVIQGYPGSFHEEAAVQYWQGQCLEILPADTFDELANVLVLGTADFAVMAIENSIAGTILQNYRILREHGLHVSGEIYLRIRHQLLGAPGSDFRSLQQVTSHPMALNQCLQFLAKYPQWKRVESIDTALSAKDLSESTDTSTACIASRMAAEKYGLNVLAPNIETHEHNYTRFFILQKEIPPSTALADKASLYIRIPDKKGQLLQVLRWIDEFDLNMSQLQSFPVLGSPREYYFHLDVEFDTASGYELLKNKLCQSDWGFHETGVYRRGSLSSIYSAESSNNL